MAQPTILMTILAFALMLGPLVLVHELGHYLVGRWCGVRVVAFSIGFGREIAGWTDRQGTRWRLSMLPLGGYVQFAGDMNPASAGVDKIPLDIKEREGWFHFKPLWQRFLIVLAGPATNLIVAVLIFAAFNMAYGRLTVPAVVGRFSENSAAQAAGVQLGDRIVAIDGKVISGFEQIPDAVKPFPGEIVRLQIERSGQRLTIPVTLAAEVMKDGLGNSARIGRLGVGRPLGDTEVTHIRMGVVESFVTAGDQSLHLMGLIATGLKQIVTGQRSVREMSGPIKMAQYSGQTLQSGWLPFVYFAAFISINLAFINLLPIPALDGGHLAFYVAEAVRRKPLDAKSQEWAFRTGIAFVLALMVFVTINDLVPADLFGL